MVESNQDVPPESLNTLLTDISLVSLAGRQAGRLVQILLLPDKDGCDTGEERRVGRKWKKGEKNA